MARLEREVQQLRNIVRRPRSPRGQAKKKLLQAPPRRLALPPLPLEPPERTEGREKEGALGEDEVRDEEDKRMHQSKVFAVPASSSGGAGLISL